MALGTWHAACALLCKYLSLCNSIYIELSLGAIQIINRHVRIRTRTNTNPNDTEANAAGRSGNARALRKQSNCGVIHEGRGIVFMYEACALY